LAFHPYTQVIPQVFNPGGFGPPHGLTRASTCPCVDHPASGPQHATTCALFRLAFATAPPPGLTSPHTMTRRLILQKARSHLTTTPQRGRCTLLRLAGTRFQVLFHNPSPGRFSPFPHGTRALSVTREYSGLPGGPGRFTQDSSSPVLLGHPFKAVDGISPTRLSRSPAPLPKGFGYPTDLSLPAVTAATTQKGPTTPHTQHLPALTRARFSLIRVRSPLLTESLLFSLPTGTEMFHFPALPPTALYIQTAATPHNWC
jgi:hypothetical protein